MTITIDPTPALIVVDLQKGTLANPMVHDVGTVVSNSVSIIDAFREKGWPVVLASVDGTAPGRNSYGAGGREFPAGWSDLVSELGEQPSDLTGVRRSWSAFAGTGLDEELHALEVTQVVVVGVATGFGVESTARAAYDFGYNVAVVTDAITDMRLEAHENSVARVFPVLGEVGTTAEVLAAIG